MSQPVAVPELLNDMIGYCSLCIDCVCFRNNQPCTGACGGEGSTTSNYMDDTGTYVFTLTSLISEEY